MPVKENKMQQMIDIREDRIPLTPLLKEDCCSNQAATRKTDQEKATSMAKLIWRK